MFCGMLFLRDHSRGRRYTSVRLGAIVTRPPWGERVQWHNAGMSERSAPSAGPTPAAARAGAFASLHFAVILFGFAGLFGKWLALPPATIVLGRTVFASVALWAALRLSREPRGRFEWRLAAGGGLLALHWVAFFEAIRIASVAIGLLGFATFPLFVLLLESLQQHRRLRAIEWTTALLVTLGLLLIIPEFRIDNRMVQGLLWGSVSGLTFALLAVGNRVLVSRRQPGEVAFWQNACAAACLLPLIVIDPAPPSLRDLALLVVLGVFCTALAHTLFIRSMRALSAHTASVVAALEPVYGIALAWILLGEAPGARTLVGAALIVGAAVFATSRPRQT
jgi:drug/metabolite transporter (DMT)-like permease